MKLISASFYFHVVIIISPCWSTCHLWMLYLHMEMSDVAHEGIHWNFFIVLATAGHSNPIFIGVYQKGNVAMLLHRLYSFSIYPSEVALNDRIFIFKPNNVSQSLLNRSSSFPCSVSQRWIMGIILILLNQVESLRYIQTHRTALVWKLSNVASLATSSITLYFPFRKYCCSFH